MGPNLPVTLQAPLFWINGCYHLLRDQHLSCLVVGHLVNLEVAGESIVPQPALLVLFLVVVPGEAPEVHWGREEAVHAPQKVILGPEEEIGELLELQTPQDICSLVRTPFPLCPLTLRA